MYGYYGHHQIGKIMKCMTMKTTRQDLTHLRFKKQWSTMFLAYPGQLTLGCPSHCSLATWLIVQNANYTINHLKCVERFLVISLQSLSRRAEVVRERVFSSRHPLQYISQFELSSNSILSVTHPVVIMGSVISSPLCIDDNYSLDWCTWATTSLIEWLSVFLSLSL